MNGRQFPQYFLTALFIFLVLAALVAGAIYTFAVGTPLSTPTASVNPKPTSSIMPEPQPPPQYPDQARITDGVIVLGIIIVAIILFGIAWGRRMTIRR
jgi:hypothetical protein